MARNLGVSVLSDGRTNPAGEVKRSPWTNPHPMNRGTPAHCPNVARHLERPMSEVLVIQ